MKIKLEICVEDAQGLDRAIKAGADRIELCSALDVGGLTPSYGLMALAGAASIPVYALIRPRSGDFHFSKPEQQVMLRDIEAAQQAGLAGIVIGANGEDDSLDMAMLARLFNHARPLKVSLHRVFDLAPDPFHALEQAVALGFERILTSGGQIRAVEALPLIMSLQQQAADRITIMPGGGIDASNVASIIVATQVDEIHASCRQPVIGSNSTISNLGFAPARPMRTSATKIRQLRTILERFSSQFLDDGLNERNTDQ